MPDAHPEKRLVRRSFERAAHGYDHGAFLQREIGTRLLAHLDPVKIDPIRTIDLGCGTGFFFEALIESRLLRRACKTFQAGRAMPASRSTAPIWSACFPAGTAASS